MRIPVRREKTNKYQRGCTPRKGVIRRSKKLFKNELMYHISCYAVVGSVL